MPGTPSIFEETSTDNSVDIFWTYEGGSDYFQIEITPPVNVDNNDGSEIINTTATTLSLTGLADDTEYIIRVTFTTHKRIKNKFEIFPLLIPQITNHFNGYNSAVAAFSYDTEGSKEKIFMIFCRIFKPNLSVI